MGRLLLNAGCASNQFRLAFDVAVRTVTKVSYGTQTKYAIPPFFLPLSVSHPPYNKAPEPTLSRSPPWLQRPISPYNWDCLSSRLVPSPPSSCHAKWGAFKSQRNHGRNNFRAASSPALDTIGNSGVTKSKPRPTYVIFFFWLDWWWSIL